MAGKARRHVTIANGAALSDKLDLENYLLAGIVMPAAWTAAAITLQAAFPDAGGTPADADFADVYDKGGTEYSLTVAASRYVALSPLDLPALRWVRLRSGTSVTPVNQAAARVVGVVLTTGR